MAFVKLISLAQLPPDTVAEVIVEDVPIAICNVNGEVRAVSGICPHNGGPLGHGAMHGENLVCPWHAWEFNSKTGRSTFNPFARLSTYRVQVEGDDILVDLDA